MSSEYFDWKHACDGMWHNFPVHMNLKHHRQTNVPLIMKCADILCVWNVYVKITEIPVNVFNEYVRSGAWTLEINWMKLIFSKFKMHENISRQRLFWNIFTVIYENFPTLLSISLKRTQQNAITANDQHSTWNEIFTKRFEFLSLQWNERTSFPLLLAAIKTKGTHPNQKET